MAKLLFDHSKARKAGGERMFRDPVPAWWHDALVIFETFRILEHNSTVRDSLREHPHGGR